MSESIKRTFVFAANNGAPSQYDHTIASDLLLSADVVIPPYGNNMEVDLALTVANVRAVMVGSDQSLKVYTNAASGGAPQDTISVAAGKEKYWDTDSLGTIALLFGGNVTKLYVCNVSDTGASANMSIRALVDITP